jgi:hypothetical protein
MLESFGCLYRTEREDSQDGKNVFHSNGHDTIDRRDSMRRSLMVYEELQSSRVQVSVINPTLRLITPRLLREQKLNPTGWNDWALAMG